MIGMLLQAVLVLLVAGATVEPPATGATSGPAASQIGATAGTPEPATTTAAAPAAATDATSPIHPAGEAATSGGTGQSEVAGIVAPDVPIPLPPTRRLTVAVAGSEPFVQLGAGTPTGISVQVWQAVATNLGIQYDLAPAPSVGDALRRVAAGEADLAIGPISITARRARRLAFTQPYYQSSLAILAPAKLGLWDRVAPFVSGAFLYGVAVLLLVLVVVGTLLWVVERKANDAFPQTPARGIGNGIWLALVTMTTVGYGDLAPVTPAGRVLGGVWMIIAMLTASSLTASIATALTLAQLDQGGISRAEELAGHRVAVVQHAPGIRFTKSYHARLVVVPTAEEAAQMVLAGDADAAVHDRPVLRYYLHEHPDAPLALSEVSYDPQGYGFALAMDSDLVGALNIALLELEEDGTMSQIRDQWLAIQ